ncbi:MAG: polysaccharide deacetylase family protein [Pseudomonadota bacterium]
MGAVMGRVRGGLVALLSECYQMVDRRRRLTVMTLHRVDGGSSITSAHVAEYLRYLAAHYDIILPNQLDSARSRRLAMVVVDDGHRDLCEAIFPVAKELQVPIAAAIPTDFFMRNAWLWFDKVHWIFDQLAPGATHEADGHRLVIGINDSEKAFKRFLKTKHPVERDAIIQQMLDGFALNLPVTPTAKYQAMSVQDVHEMLATGLFEVVGHTRSHPILSLLRDDQLVEEIQDAKQELEVCLGRPISSFCYPNGLRGDFNDRTRRIVKAAGFDLAFTSVDGTNLLSCMDRYEIKRVHAHPNAEVMKKSFSGLLDFQNALAGWF